MALSRDNQSTFSGSSGATVSGTLTISASANLLLIFIGGNGVSTNPSSFGIVSATAGGVAMTRIYTSPDYVASSANVECWALVNPPTGASIALVLTRGASGFAPTDCTAKSYIGGDTSTPTGTITRTAVNSPSASAYTGTVNVSSATGEITESFLMASPNHTTAATTAGFQTQDGTATGGNSEELRTGWAPGAASVTHSYDLQADASARVANILSLSVRVGGGGGGGAQGAGTQSKMAGDAGRMTKRMAA